MVDFLLLVVAAFIAAGVVFAVFSFALGRTPGMADPEPDGVAEPLPDHPLGADDLDDVRFDVVLRGYRMDQVDAVVNRVANDLRQLQEQVESLESQLAAYHQGRRTTADEDSTPQPADHA